MGEQIDVPALLSMVRNAKNGTTLKREEMKTLEVQLSKLAYMQDQYTRAVKLLDDTADVVGRLTRHDY